MINFLKSAATFNTSEFNQVLKNEITQLDNSLLPLQQALKQTSYVSNTHFSIVILSTQDNTTHITSKTGVFFTGIIAGSCCSDDPTPVDEVQEYCEVEFCINKETAEVSITLLDD